MRKVTHQTISEELSKTVLLPCVFTLHPSSSAEVPRVKWTKVWGQRGSDGLQKEQSVLVARDNVVKVALVLCRRNVLRPRSLFSRSSSRRWRRPSRAAWRCLVTVRTATTPVWPCQGCAPVTPACTAARSWWASTTSKTRFPWRSQVNRALVSTVMPINCCSVMDPLLWSDEIERLDLV